MKFSCERCGKRYATADTPAPGRIYKIKCKACGHLIVVKASTGAPPSAATAMRPPTSVGIPAVNAAIAPPELRRASPPDLELEIGAPEPADHAPSNGGYPNALQPRRDPTQEVSMSGFAVEPAKEEFRPPPGDSGYVDLFAEPQKQEQERSQVDPFGAGAPAPASDPFVALGEELSIPTADRSQQAAGRATTAPKIPVIPKRPQQKSATPMILIGVGALVLIGILAFVLLGGSPAVRPRVKAQAPASIPQVQPAVAPPAPAAAAPEDPDKPQRTDKNADRRAR